MKNLIPIFALLFLCFWSQAHSTLILGMEKLKWEIVMPGVWEAFFGKTGLNAFDFADSPKSLKKSNFDYSEINWRWMTI